MSPGKMMKRNGRHKFLGIGVLLCLIPTLLWAQPAYTLKECLDYALENNRTLQKSRYDQEKSYQARKEVMGALLPQVSGSGSMSYNLQKTTFAMPNFMNAMLPEAMQDPNAAKYMTIEMGMNYSANFGANLVQQLVNFSLLNALDIARTVQRMAEVGVEMNVNEVIAQTATLYYSIQVLSYAVQQFDESLSLMEKTLAMMEVNQANDLIRKVDVDRVRISKTNLETQRSSLQNAVAVQKNLLKLQMGFEMSHPLEVAVLDMTIMERLVERPSEFLFDVSNLLPYQLVKEQQQMVLLQKRSAIYETLPALTFGANYMMNLMSDEFFKGETYHHFPVSALSLNLRVPLFTGFSKKAKINQAKYEVYKSQQDEAQLSQSLTMAYLNASMKLDESRRTIVVQKANKQLAQEVYTLTNGNYSEGLAALSDVLNASSSLIQSQVSYADALNSYMKAYIDIKKANGTIRDLMN